MAGDSRITTESFLATNFTPNGGITTGSDNLLGMSCDQVATRYNVTINGISSADQRIPGQNEIVAAVAPATVSMSCSLTAGNVGVSRYTLTLTVVATTTVSVTVSFALDFLAGSVPSGQPDYRGAAITKIPEVETPLYGEGTIRSYTSTFSSGTSTVNFVLALINDNWSDPVPSTTFRVRLMAGSGAVLSVPNSTTTNGTTFVTTKVGVLTTPITIVPYYGGRSVSGDMILFRVNRNNNLNVISQKDIEVTLTLNTGTYSSSKLFVLTYFTNDGNFDNYMSTSYTHGTTITDIATTASQYTAIHYYRFSVLNQSGNSSAFSATISPSKYCSFTPVTYSNTLSSLVPGAHVFTQDSFTGNLDNLPIPIIIPGTTSLSAGELFSYKYVAHCPTGSYIRLSSGGSPVATLYDMDEYAVTNVPFRSVNITSSPTNVSLGTNGSPNHTVIFTATNQYLELVPTTSNITKNALWPCNLGYYGLI